MRVGPTLDRLAKAYGKNLRIVFKHYVVHPNRATIPALAACAAQRQGKFMKMYRLIFGAYGRFAQADMDQYARGLRLNMGKFHKDMERCKNDIRQDQIDMARVGARGVPAFFINGRFLSGNRPYAHFKRLIDEVLHRARRSRIPARRYYQREVLGRGKPTL